MVPGAVALVAVATLESVIGLCLIAGRGMRGAVYLLVIQLGGILSPIVLLPGRLFSGAGIAPTLEGQCVLKDIIIVGAALVLAATILGGARLSTQASHAAAPSVARPHRAAAPHPARLRPPGPRTRTGRGWS